MKSRSFAVAGPDGFPIRMRTTSPSSPQGSVVICHGFKGYMDWGFFPWLAERIAAAGLRAISFDFSGSGMTTAGAFADQDAFFSNTFSRELRDLNSVVAESERQGWLADGYGLFGHSRGGGVAVLHAASNDSVRALVTWSAISTVRRWSEKEMTEWRERGWLEVRNARTGETLRQGAAILEEVEKEADDRLNIAAAAARVRVPWLIVHGTSDETVKVDEALRLKEAARPGVARLETIDTDHTYGIRHPMRERSAALERAASLTLDLYAAELG